MARDAEQAQTADQHRLVLGVYALQLLGLMLVFTPILGLALNYARRPRAEGTIYASHFDWQIRTVWWTLLWGLPGGGLMYLGTAPEWRLAGVAGALLLLVTAFWFMYRVLKGYLYLSASRALPTRTGPSKSA